MLAIWKFDNTKTSIKFDLDETSFVYSLKIQQLFL